MFYFRRNLTLWCMQLFFMVGSFFRKGRATHRRGVAGVGRFVVDPELSLPPHDFFAPGRVYRATLRHGNVSNDDDAGLDIRGAALQLADLEDPDKPGLDLIMNTGELTFSTARVFFRYARATVPRPWQDTPTNEAGLRRFLERDERARAQFVQALRRAPESFASLAYYTKIVYAWRAMDGRRRFCRFRLVPDGMTTESGLPDAKDLAQPWCAERRVGDTRPHDYLRQEFKERLSAPEGVRYHLEMQLREPPDENAVDPALFDPGTAWPDDQYPWHRLGSVHLTRRASEVEAEQLWFNLEHRPPSLDLLESFSPDDFHSVAWMRIRIYSASQAVRSAVFWRRQRKQARIRHIDQTARGTHGLTPEQRRQTSIWTLITKHMRR